MCAATIPRARHPHEFAGVFQVEEHGVHWVIEGYVLRKHGVVLAGPPPASSSIPFGSTNSDGPCAHTFIVGEHRSRTAPGGCTMQHVEFMLQGVPDSLGDTVAETRYFIRYGGAHRRACGA